MRDEHGAVGRLPPGNYCPGSCLDNARRGDAPLARVTSADVPIPYAANLEALALPRPEDIVTAVKEVCYRA